MVGSFTAVRSVGSRDVRQEDDGDASLLIDAA
jgi:hypothetical protein